MTTIIEVSDANELITELRNIDNIGKTISLISDITVMLEAQSDPLIISVDDITLTSDTGTRILTIDSLQQSVQQDTSVRVLSSSTIDNLIITSALTTESCIDILSTNCNISNCTINFDSSIGVKLPVNDFVMNNCILQPLNINTNNCSIKTTNIIQQGGQGQQGQQNPEQTEIGTLTLTNCTINYTNQGVILENNVTMNLTNINNINSNTNSTGIELSKDNINFNATKCNIDYRNTGIMTNNTIDKLELNECKLQILENENQINNGLILSNPVSELTILDCELYYKNKGLSITGNSNLINIKNTKFDCVDKNYTNDTAIDISINSPIINDLNTLDIIVDNCDINYCNKGINVPKPISNNLGQINLEIKNSKINNTSTGDILNTESPITLEKFSIGTSSNYLNTTIDNNEILYLKNGIVSSSDSLTIKNNILHNINETDTEYISHPITIKSTTGLITIDNNNYTTSGNTQIDGLNYKPDTYDDEIITVRNGTLNYTNNTSLIDTKTHWISYDINAEISTNTNDKFIQTITNNTLKTSNSVLSIEPSELDSTKYLGELTFDDNNITIMNESEYTGVVNLNYSNYNVNDLIQNSIAVENENKSVPPFIFNSLTVCESENIHMYAAVSDSGYIIISNDGIKWNTIVLNEKGYKWNTITYSPKLNKIVVIARDENADINTTEFVDRVITSINGGKSWSYCNIQNYDWRSVVWVDNINVGNETGAFIAVGHTDMYAHSINGTQWNVLQLDQLTNNYWNSITTNLDGTHIVAVGGDDNIENSGNIMYFTHDSIKQENTWSIVNGNDHKSYIWLSICGCDGNTYAAVSNNGIMTTNNYNTWIVQNIIGEWCSISYSPEYKRICAISSTTVDEQIIISDDNGLNWTPYLFEIMNSWNLITWSKYLNNFCIIARYGNYASRFASSNNGIDWNTNSSISVNAWKSICWSNELKIFCAVGQQISPYLIATSSDGINWVMKKISNWNNAMGLTTVCWSSKLNMFCLLSSSSLIDIKDTIFTSSDGDTWTLQQLPENSSNGLWTSICYAEEFNNNEGLFCACAYSLVDNNASHIIYSHDGIEWFNSNTLITGLNGICWSKTHNRFIAVGNNNIIYSSDAINWTEADISTIIDASFKSVSVSNNGKLVAVYVSFNEQNTNLMAVSTDGGNTWNSFSVQIEQTIYDKSLITWNCITYSYDLDMFCVVGSNYNEQNVILFAQSNDLTTWSKRAVETVRLSSVVYSNYLGMFCCVDTGYICYLNVGVNNFNDNLITIIGNTPINQQGDNAVMKTGDELQQNYGNIIKISKPQEQDYNVNIPITNDNIYKLYNKVKKTDPSLFTNLDEPIILYTETKTDNILEPNMKNITYTQRSNIAYGINTGYTGVVSQFSVNAVDLNNDPVSDFTSKPIIAKLILPNANINNTLKIFKMDPNDTTKILDPQPEGYPTQLTYDNVSNIWTGQLQTISDFTILDEQTPPAPAGGDPHIITVYNEKRLLPNGVLTFVLYDYKNIKLIAHTDYLTKDFIKKLHNYTGDNRTVRIRINKHKYITQYTYFTQLDFYMDDTISLSINTLNGSIIHNDERIIHEILIPKALYSITQKLKCPIKKSITRCIHLVDSDYIVVTVDNFWGDVNCLELYVKDICDRKGEYFVKE